MKICIFIQSLSFFPWSNSRYKLSVKNMEYLVSTMVILVFDILISWKWLGTNLKPELWLNATLTCSVMDEKCYLHASDVIMNTMASQITSLTIVYSTVYSGADQRNSSKLRVTGLCEGNSPATGECPAQRASNAENVSIFDVITTMSKTKMNNRMYRNVSFSNTSPKISPNLYPSFHCESMGILSVCFH